MSIADQRQHEREAKRQERLRALLNSVPHVKRAAQMWTEQAAAEAERTTYAERQIDD